MVQHRYTVDINAFHVMIPFRFFYDTIDITYIKGYTFRTFTNHWYIPLIYAVPFIYHLHTMHAPLQDGLKIRPRASPAAVV